MNITELIEEICQNNGVKIEYLTTSDKRITLNDGTIISTHGGPVSLTRHEIAYTLYLNFPGMSVKQIGVFINRDIPGTNMILNRSKRKIQFEKSFKENIEKYNLIIKKEKIEIDPEYKLNEKEQVPDYSPWNDILSYIAKFNGVSIDDLKKGDMIDVNKFRYHDSRARDQAIGTLELLFNNHDSIKAGKKTTSSAYYSQRDIANILNISAATVNTALTRIRAYQDLNITHFVEKFKNHSITPKKVKS